MSNEEMVANNESVRKLAEECPEEAAIIMEMLAAADVDTDD
jgi:hypothetical protein